MEGPAKNYIHRKKSDSAMLFPGFGNKVYVAFCLDRSGSMEAVRDETIEAFNAYRDTLEKEAKIDGTEVLFSMIQFDTEAIDRLYSSTAISAVKPLTSETYRPRAGTPLIDAAYKTIKATERAVGGDDCKVVVAILTDGQENASREHTWDDLLKLVKEKTALGWQFIFMGAGIDAYEQGAKMGVAAAATLSYDKLGRVETRAAFEASAFNTMDFASGRKANVNYSTEQKELAGDHFDKRR